MDSRQTAMIALALVVLGLGFWLYASSASQYDQCQTTIGGIAQVLSQTAVATCRDVSTRHTGGLGVMGLGAILFLIGLFGPKGKP